MKAWSEYSMLWLRFEQDASQIHQRNESNYTAKLILSPDVVMIAMVSVFQ
jgi:hypothetical protein